MYFKGFIDKLLENRKHMIFCNFVQSGWSFNYFIDWKLWALIFDKSGLCISIYFGSSRILIYTVYKRLNADRNSQNEFITWVIFFSFIRSIRPEEHYIFYRNFIFLIFNKTNDFTFSMENVILTLRKSKNQDFLVVFNMIFK